MHSFFPLTGPHEGSRTPSPHEGAKSHDHLSPDPTASMTPNSSPGAGGGIDYYSVSEPSSTPNPLGYPQHPGAFMSSLHHQHNFPRVVSASQAGSCENLASVATKNNGKANPVRRRHSVKGRLQGATGGANGTEDTVKRRQKRLERNRESARLSRRRRKQYLEVLEENVNQLSRELDQGRREHVSKAIWTIHNKRLELLAGPGKEDRIENLASLEKGLSRTSKELMVVNTFQWQQLKSFVLPPSSKFTLWLTLQNDTFFRGGRASSERLSAARIGERMLSSGTDRVTPTQSMWPLFCNEVGLSYEQEEKVRSYQRTLLLTRESWLHRHSAYAAEKTMKSLHDSLEAITQRLAQKEYVTQAVLTPGQRMKLAVWSTRNREFLRSQTGRVPVERVYQTYTTSKTQHEAANLYVLNHQLQQVLGRFPLVDPIVNGDKLKKLSRRPLFESLGCALEKEEGLSRDGSFASTGSLKRGMAEMSMDGEEKVHIPSLNPEDAQAAAVELVEKTLGHLKRIIPEPPIPSYIAVCPNELVLPAPTPVASMSQPFYQPVSMNHATAMDAQAGSMQQIQNMFMNGSESKHARKSSFLPPHLNVVPEEIWNSDCGEHDDLLLMNLVDGDWAIGEGIDMDMLH